MIVLFERQQHISSAVQSAFASFANKQTEHRTAMIFVLNATSKNDRGIDQSAEDQNPRMAPPRRFQAHIFFQSRCFFGIYSFFKGAPTSRATSRHEGFLRAC
jgi:hypothetical protein